MVWGFARWQTMSFVWLFCQLMKIYQWCVDLHNHSIACTLLIVMLILSCADPSFISLYYFVPHPYPSIILWYFFMYHYFVSVCSACCIYICFWMACYLQLLSLSLTLHRLLVSIADPFWQPDWHRPRNREKQCCCEYHSLSSSSPSASVVRKLWTS